MGAQRTVPLLYKNGIHLRSAGEFIKTANKFRSDIRLTVKGRTVNAKSYIDVLLLATPPGVNLILEAEGDDAEQSLDALADLIKNNFNLAEE
jgi:phosphocarrier protein